MQTAELHRPSCGLSVLNREIIALRIVANSEYPDMKKKAAFVMPVFVVHRTILFTHIDRGSYSTC